MRNFLNGNDAEVAWEELNISGAIFNMSLGTTPLIASISDTEIIILDSFPGKSSRNFIFDTRRINLRSIENNSSFYANETQCMPAGQNRIAALVDDLHTSDNKRIEVYRLVGDSEDRSTLVRSLSLWCSEQFS